MDPTSTRPGASPTPASARLPRANAMTISTRTLEHGRRQATLAAFSRSVLSIAGVTELLVAATRALGHALQTPYTAAFEYDPSADVLRLRAGAGWRAGSVGTTVLHTGTEFHEGYALDRPEPIVVADHNAEIRFAASPLLIEHGILSSICTAVRNAQAQYGLLGAYARQPRAFTQDDAQFLQVVGHITSTALARIDAESALAVRHAPSAARTEGVPDLLFRLDRAGTCIDFWARSHQEILAQPGELAGRKLSEFLPPAAAVATAAALERALVSRDRQVFRYEIDSAGQRVTCEARMLLHGDDAVVAIVRDLDDRPTDGAPRQARPGRDEPVQRQDAARTAHAESVQRDRDGRLRTMQRVVEIAVSTQPLDVALQLVLREIVQATGYPMAAIDLWDAERQRIVLGAATVLPGRARTAPVERPLNGTLSGPIIQSGRAHVETTDATTPERREALQRIGATTFACFPLVALAEVVGALSLAHPQRMRQNADFSDWMTGLCRCVALLVHGRRAREKCERLDASVRRDVA